MKYLFIVNFITIIVLSGCAVNRGTIQSAGKIIKKSNENIVLIDAGYYTKGGLATRVWQSAHKLLRGDALERQFYLVDHRVEKTLDDRLSVYFVFLNSYGVRNWLDLHLIFYDESGKIVEQTDWEVKEFPKMTKTIYSKTSLNPTAIGYELYVRDYR